MDSDKNASPSKDPSEEEIKQDVLQAPADALSRTPDELANEAAATRKAEDAELPPVKKVSAFKRVLKKVNVYFLIFFILLAVAGAIAAVNFINSQKEPEVADLAAQEIDAASVPVAVPVIGGIAAVFIAGLIAFLVYKNRKRSK